MAKNGKNVVLMRDMTDTMYNPERWPYVTHFVGTDRIVEHIEKFVCPTITSVDFLGGEPFRFKNDRRAILMVIGEDEYKTDLTLPSPDRSWNRAASRLLSYTPTRLTRTTFQVWLKPLPVQI